MVAINGVQHLYGINCSPHCGACYICYLEKLEEVSIMLLC
jgi:hypothetical protein